MTTRTRQRQKEEEVARAPLPKLRQTQELCQYVTSNLINVAATEPFGGLLPNRSG